MYLKINEDPVIKDPTSDDLAREVTRLANGENDHIILGAAPDLGTHFLQAFGDSDYGYTLQVAGGMDEFMRQTTDEDVTIERMVASFQMYAAGDPAWRHGYEWEEMDVGGEPVEKEGCLGMVVFVLMGAGLLLAWL